MEMSKITNVKKSSSQKELKPKRTKAKNNSSQKELMSKTIYVQKIKANNNHIERKSVEDSDIKYTIYCQRKVLDK